MDFLEEYMELSEITDAEKNKKNVKKVQFSTEEKKKLCRLVQERPVIWDLGDKSHSDGEAVHSAWRYIAEDMNRKVDECKTSWKSLRGSLRYHKSGKRKLKSGSAATSSVNGDTEEHLSDDDTIDWEFSECLAFLKPNSGKRTTFSSIESEGPPECTQQEQETPSSSYNFSPKPAKKDSMLESVVTLTQTVTELMNLRRTEVPQEKQDQQPLANYSLLANLDRVLKELPTEVVEDLGLSFQQQAITELRKHRNRGL